MHGMKKNTNKLIYSIAVIIAVLICPKALSCNTTDQTEEANVLEYPREYVEYYYASQNFIEAIKWCNIIINEGPNDYKNRNKNYAYSILGLCAYNGLGMSKSVDDAIAYWEKGTHYVGGISYRLLAEHYYRSGNEEKAFNLYKRAAKSGDVEAALIVAQAYDGHSTNYEGLNMSFSNIKNDVEQAAEYYNLYINNSKLPWVTFNCSVLYKLGMWNYTGNELFSQDYSRALDLFVFSITHNNSTHNECKLSFEEEGNAFWNISVCYRFGRGVEKDELKARRYVKKAAEKGNTNAINILNNK